MTPQGFCDITDNRFVSRCSCVGPAKSPFSITTFWNPS